MTALKTGVLAGLFVFTLGQVVQDWVFYNQIEELNKSQTECRRWKESADKGYLMPTNITPAGHHPESSLTTRNPSPTNQPKAFESTVSNGLEKWIGKGKFGTYIATNTRIAVVSGKYQPQFHMPNGTWSALFEGSASFEDADLARSKLERAFVVQKEVTDQLSEAFRSAFSKTNQPSAWPLDLPTSGK